MGSNETLTDLLGIYYKGTVVLLFKEGRSVHSGDAQSTVVVGSL